MSEGRRRRTKLLWSAACREPSAGKARIQAARAERSKHPPRPASGRGGWQEHAIGPGRSTDLRNWSARPKCTRGPARRTPGFVNVRQPRPVFGEPTPLRTAAARWPVRAREERTRASPRAGLGFEFHEFSRSPAAGACLFAESRSVHWRSLASHQRKRRTNGRTMYSSMVASR